MEELEFIPIGTTGVWFTAVLERPVGRDNPTMVGPTAELFVDDEDDGPKILVLRFDPFAVDKANGPHYHYWIRGDKTSLGMQYLIDTTLVGNQVSWTRAILRNKLPDMLRRCGYAKQAQALEDNPDELDGALVRVDAIIRPTLVAA